MTRKQRALYRDLKKKVMTMPPLSRFAAVREIMHEYQVSQGIVDYVFRVLKEEKLLVSHIGDGTYTTMLESRGDSARTRLGIIMPDYQSSHYAAVTAELVAKAEALGFHYEVKYVYWSHPLRVGLEFSVYDAVIVFPGKMPMDSEDVDFLRSLHIPVVILELDTCDVGLDSVGGDYAAYGALAADHLCQLGHRRLAVLNPEPPVSTVLSRISGFVDRARALGAGGVRVFECGTSIGDDAVANAYTLVKSAAGAGEIDFSGLFVISDTSVIAILRALAENDLTSPRDISIVGCGNLPEGRYYQPTLTTIDQRLDRWSSAAFEIISERRRGSTAPIVRTTVAPVLVKRESTAECAETADVGCAAGASAQGLPSE